MIRPLALAAAALLFAQTANACIVGSDTSFFTSAPTAVPAGHEVVRAEFSTTSDAYRDFITRPRAPEHQHSDLLGVATFPDGEVLPVWGSLRGCSYVFEGKLGAFYLVGKFVSEADARAFLAAGCYAMGGEPCRWRPVS